ncbi:hypothetical protein JOF53_001998 [Crossiella equi]|uniref:Outer membrane channel protein CpnT-like N-terminal domain-containing protein n=1 Tax=Crossiella equi TaxID=130796 RepID=A0ABS5A978_9PSEU|nr:hypothetical protein [Crossiella equi]MBP2473126.1 hypothetical protein [Crossiella equi]
MSNPNPLIAQPEPVEATAGAGLYDSVTTMFKDVNEADASPLDLTIDGISVGLDVLAIVMNPLGELLKAGVGWLLEHVEWLREPLEVLTGDPKQVKAIADTWDRIGTQLQAAGEQYQGALGGVRGWEGEAANAYRGVAEDYASGLILAAEEARDTASWITGAGVVVATARAIIFDMIASFISRVIAQALIAAATAVFSLGSSVALFITSVVTDAGILMGRITAKIAALLKKIEQFMRRFKLKGTKLGDAATAIQHKANKMRREANSAVRQGNRARDALKPQEGWQKTYSDYVDRRAESGLGKFSDHNATRLGKEAAKGFKELNGEDKGGKPQ